MVHAKNREDAKDIVVTRLIGGLGNQMFQYAAGRALALRIKASLKLDLSGFSADPKRRYELDCFPIRAVAATDIDLQRCGAIPGEQPKLMTRALRRLGVHVPTSKVSMYRERHFHFDDNLATLRAPVYLDGFWQSERYFVEVAQTVRREFTPTQPFDANNRAFADRISAVKALSLHVRRGDYVDEQGTNRFHGTCSLAYYQRAVEYVSARIAEVHLFVFSDDQRWARENLQFDFPTTFVDANTPDCGFLDMQLMCRCHHHILANSSFSWWGAWLNPSLEKIVIAPARWFNAAGIDTRDLIPKQWVRL